MIKLAGEYTERERYLKAAKKFRFPYWDYFKARDYKKEGFEFPGIRNGQRTLTRYPYAFTVPRVLTEPKVMVYHWDNEKEMTSIDNPLLKFNFKLSGNDLPPEDWEMVSTVRRIGSSHHQAITHFMIEGVS